nr:zinc finger CCCH domain-containing protein 32-like [Malus domestica]
MRYNLSASSPVDMPVVQYPVGSLLATLAPSSSSSDLRPPRSNVAIGADEQRIVPGETRRAQLCLLHANRVLWIRWSVPVVAAIRATGDYPERVGKPVCQYIYRLGPVNLGENECFYYLKTGQCKFGITCKFHHPQPAGTTIPASVPQFYPLVQSPVPLAEQYGGASTSLRVARPPLLTGSYVQGTYCPVLIPPPGVVPIQGWSPYSAPLSAVPSPGAQPTVGATSLYGVTQLSSPTHGLASPYTSIPSSVGPSSSNPSEQVFPERPGELECQYYLKTGDCKYGPSCRYHHPRDRTVPRITCLLSPMGLPLRPVCKVVLYYF